jgi:phosphoribosylamine--glycine ligase
MKVLVVGGGGREHAICRALTTGPDPIEILTAPGNPGTAALGRNLPIPAGDVDGLVAAAGAEMVDLVVPGPELPLTLGLGDALAAAGIPCCGPLAEPSRLEGSKAFTREVGLAAGVDTPRFRVVDGHAGIDAALSAFGEPPVVKADGLAGGKGVFLPDDFDGCRRAIASLLDGALGEAGRTVVVEERLEGTEASLFYAVDGTRTVLLPHARDHKRLLDGGRGPNTGGMGAISPNPDLDDEVVAGVTDGLILPVLDYLAGLGRPYRGFLYAGLMLTDAGPRLLEFNVRLGDPEAQGVLPRLPAGTLAALAGSVAHGRLDTTPIPVDPRPTWTVVMAADGYPDRPRRGDPITIEPWVEGPDRWVDHAGTRSEDGRLVTAGGRVLSVVARGATPEAARSAAYDGVAGIHWDGARYRTDIGTTEGPG